MKTVNRFSAVLAAAFLLFIHACSFAQCLIATAIPNSSATCFGQCTGSIDLQVTGGTPPYTYEWSNGKTDQDIIGLCAGTYSVTVRDVQGCMDTAMATIHTPQELLLDVFVQANCFSQMATLYPFAMGGTEPYIYYDTYGDTIDISVGVPPGSHSVKVVDAKGCIAEKQIEVTVPQPITISYTKTNADCAGGCTGSIDLTITGGGFPRFIFWDSGYVAEDLENLCPGTYIVNVYDYAQCFATDTIVIEVAASSDVQVEKTASETVVAGEGTIEYGITLSNNGPCDAVNVQLEDILPIGTSLLSVTPPPGWVLDFSTEGVIRASRPSLSATTSPQIFTVTVSVSPSFRNNAVVQNTASVSNDIFDSNTANNTASATTTVSTRADLSVEKTAQETVFAGDEIVYTIKVRNNGPSDAYDVIITDKLPLGTELVSVATPDSWSSLIYYGQNLLNEEPEVFGTPMITTSSSPGWNISYPALPLGYASNLEMAIPHLHLPPGETILNMVVRVSDELAVGDSLVNIIVIDDGDEEIDIHPVNNTGDAVTVVESYDLDGDGFSTSQGDCDDNNAAIHPGAQERCNGVDDDCDGLVDEDFPLLGAPCDGSDGDGCPTGIWICDGLGGVTCSETGPGNTEICNYQDDDCDGLVDEDFPLLGTPCDGPDADGCTNGIWICDGLGGVTCAEFGAVIPEQCNGIDDDCDGQIDEGCDLDGDGFSISQGDCDDNNAAIHPGAQERCNGVDDDCDGLVDEDFPLLGAPCDGTDGDGCPTGIWICDGLGGVTCSETGPGNTEICNYQDDDCDGLVDEDFPLLGTPCDGPDADGCTNGIWICDGLGSVRCAEFGAVIPEQCSNGIDDDCDGQVDEGCDLDGDGFSTSQGDCNDNNAAIHPGAQERCNGVDDDCDDLVDEDFPQLGSACDGTDGDGCATGFWICDGLGGVTCSETGPGTTELCNGVDDDCDGLVDENFPLLGTPCDGPDADGCTNGIWICDGLGGVTCAEFGAVIPEQCNGIDDDCDGQIDEGCDLDGDGFSTSQGDCNDQNAAIYPGAQERCNGVDDDCDGVIDEGYIRVKKYPDNDRDGFGDAGHPGTLVCILAPGWVFNNWDCNDANAAIHPGSKEICNGIDDNCNGRIDEGLIFRNYFVDADGDGRGNMNAQPVNSCKKIPGYVTNKLDCNDANPQVYPGARERCNGIDDNCNGRVDERCSNNSKVDPVTRQAAEIVAGKSVKIYPNPFKEQFNIELDGFVNEEVQITIVNILGQIMLNKLVQVDGYVLEQVNVSGFAPGLYSVSIRTTASYQTYNVIKSE